MPSKWSICNKPALLWSLLALLPSIYFWRRSYHKYIVDKKKWEEETLFDQRHNCVVMYSKSRMSGWPPNLQGIDQTTRNYMEFLEPFTYFISTAQKSLDIAIMTIHIKPVIKEICLASRRGVKVRIILNLESVYQQTETFHKLRQEGVSILFYVSPHEALSSIMHNKYIVKDYNDNEGYVCMGSLNLSHISALLENFEDVVFTSNHFVASAFHDNFEDCWKVIKEANGEILNKRTLFDRNVLQYDSSSA